MQQLKLRLYAEARTEIRSGDLGLARPDSLFGALITHDTHAIYSHATLFGWSQRTLMIGETREHRDARLIDARAEIRRSPPGCYDVFRPRRPRYDGRASWRFVCQAAGARYGWPTIARVFCRRVCGWTWIPPIANSDAPQSPRDCSALAHAALREGGGPQLRAFDCDVVPGDLADPAAMQYLFTLVATEEQLNELERRLLRPRLPFPPGA
jgi:hypothetical protein